MRTEKEIKRQIDGVTEMYFVLPEISLFGTKNHNIRDEIIDILTLEKNYDEVDYDFDKPDNIDLDIAAYDASEWLKGNNNEDLFDII